MSESGPTQPAEWPKLWRLIGSVIVAAVGIVGAWSNPYCDIWQFGGWVGVVFMWVWGTVASYVMLPLVPEWMDRLGISFPEPSDGESAPRP